MKILGIHTDRVWYKVTKKTKIAEPDPVREDEMENCVLLFASVEKSDELSPELTVSATVYQTASFPPRGNPGDALSLCPSCKRSRLSGRIPVDLENDPEQTH